MKEINIKMCQYESGWLKCKNEAEYELIIDNVSHGLRCEYHKKDANSK